MAVTAFEYKKIFSNKNQYSILTFLGPLLISSILLSIVKLILDLASPSFSDNKLFMASIIYIFIFSQLVTSGFSSFIFRYISDMLYIKDFEKIISSFYGITLLCLSTGSLFSIIFFFKSPLSLLIKATTYILYIQLIIIWLQTTFLTVLRQYMKICKSFFIGLIAITISSFVLINFTEWPLVFSLLTAMNTGIIITISLLMKYLNKFFRVKNFENTYSISSNKFFEKYFDFINYTKEYSTLFFINFIFTLSLYIHIFMFWYSDFNIIISDTYLLATKYDVPAFFALITSIPAMLLFIRYIESTFYVKNQNSNISVGLKNIMNIQILVTFILLLLGYVFLPMLGFTNDMLAIFSLLTLGAYCSIFILISILIHLHFDNRKNPLIISLSFLITNILFTGISIWAGPEYYGLGYLISALLSVIISGLMLKNYLRKQYSHNL
ncbi:exopolysaccharide Pel transporter PelG [Clostridium sp. DL1XJH146]